MNRSEPRRGAPKRRLTFARVRRYVQDNAYVLLLALLVLWTIFPLIWAVTASFKSYAEVYRVPPSILPEQMELRAYQVVLESPNFYTYLGNSALVSVVSSLIAIVVSVLAGYAFARYDFRFKAILLLLILIPRIIPRASLIIPLFQMMSSLRMLDSYLALIVTYTATAIPLNIMVLSGYFSTIPRELEEAAAIDGAKPWQRLLYVVLPMAAPALITVTVMSLREGWNEFPFVLALTTSTRMRTLPYQLFLLRDSMGIEDWPVVLAFTFLTILPILVLYLIFQRKAVEGLVSGALK